MRRCGGASAFPPACTGVRRGSLRPPRRAKRRCSSLQYPSACDERLVPDLRDGHPATAEQGERVARLLERTELHREAGDRLRRARCHLPLVLPHALVLVEELEDADEARTGQGQDSALFFRGDSDDAISFASASESSKTRSLSFLPAATAALNSETLSTGMENEWFFPPRVYWRLW